MSVSRACSRVRRTVISFVRLAIGTCRCGFWARSTSPVRPSATRYARAFTLGPVAKAGGTSERAAVARARSLSFTAENLDQGPADDEHRGGHEQQECDRKRIAPRLGSPGEAVQQA